MSQNLDIPDIRSGPLDRRTITINVNILPPPHTQTPTFTHQAEIPHFLPLPRSSETIQLTLKADDDEWPFLLHAEFTPRGQSIVLVHTYDIYYKPSARATQTYRLTKTAIPGIIYNGVPDWLYEGN